jgi:hypothetical protein
VALVGEEKHTGCKPVLRTLTTGLFGRGEERGGELFVECEEEFDALTVVGEGLGAGAEVRRTTPSFSKC